jgi:arginine metabolism regulation protein II
LTFLETEFVTNAKRAGLYGLLCLSANHLAKNPTFDLDLDRQDGYWDVVAQLCKAEAAHHLQRSFAEEIRGPNKAKYKDQLIATLNLLGVSVSRPSFSLGQNIPQSRGRFNNSRLDQYWRTKRRPLSDG